MAMTASMLRGPVSDAIETTADLVHDERQSGGLPGDWSAVPLGKLCRFANGVNADKRAYGSGVPFINVLEVITHSHLRARDIPGLVRLTKEQREAFAVRRGDVLFNRTSETQEEVGLSALYDDDADVVFGGFVIRGRFVDASLDSAYAGYGLRSATVRRQIVTQGQGVVRANIGQANLRRVVIPVPPKAEQGAIAEALGDIDGLIGALESLISRKRNIKQAAMQQLLTAKTRLSGFTGEWAEIDMARDSTLKARIGWQGLTTAEYLEAGDYVLVTGTDFVRGRIDWANCHFVDRSRFVQDKNIQLAIGDVLLTKDGTIGKAGFVNALPAPATLNSGIFVVRPRASAYIPLYMYYILTSQVFEDFLTRLQAGSTIVHLYQKDFVGFTFQAPPLAEQLAIATVLSDMDSEITALEQRRDKACEIKQGMMQQLLTGRIRLVKPQPAAAHA